jgi:hypothetical protein
MLVCYLAYFSTPKIEVICSSETSMDFQRTRRRYMPEGRTIHKHGCENSAVLKICGSYGGRYEDAI